MQSRGEDLCLSASSSGGGLPGRLDLEKDPGVRYLGGFLPLKPSRDF
jgi:hypothetical protein